MVTTRRDGTRVRVASPLVNAFEVIARRNTNCDGRKTAREKEAYESRNRKTKDGSSAQFVIYRSGESQMHANRKGDEKRGRYRLPLTRPGDGYLYTSPEQWGQVHYVRSE